MSVNTNTIRAADIKAELAHYTGSERFYRHGLMRNLFMTEGAHRMAELCEAHWLIDVIASHQLTPAVRTEEFQVWQLVRLEEPTPGVMARVICDDGNGNVLVTQDLPYTDVPLPTIKLYAELGSLDGRTQARIIMLPRER